MASPAHAEVPPSADEGAADIDDRAKGPEIVVTVRRDDGSFSGIPASDELDENDIAALGVDKVSDVLGELTGLRGDGETPAILINGQPADGLADVADLPAEAVTKVQLLPRGTAVQLGLPQTRPVINVVVKRDFRLTVALAQAGGATAGGSANGSGELTYTRAVNGNRLNLSAKVREEGMLLESERGLGTADETSLPYDGIGNVVAWPLVGSEIDPALSAVAGRTLTVVAVPAGTDSPTLADFVGEAGLINSTGEGVFRSLLPKVRTASLNATMYRRLSAKTNLLLSGQFNYSKSQALTGLTSAALVLPAASPFSPFSRDVLVARFLGDPLDQAYRSASSNLAATLNTSLADWRLTVNGSWAHSATRTVTDEPADLGDLQDAVTAGTASPFGSAGDELHGPAPLSQATGRTDSFRLQATATGPILNLPAGPMIGNALIGALIDRSKTESILGPARTGFRSTRDELVVQGGLQVPLIAAGADGQGGIGSLAATFALSERQLKHAGSFLGYSYGLRWAAAPSVNFEATMDDERKAPQIRSLTDPIVARDGVRVFDFIRNETVEVTYLTGGNRNLPPQRLKTLTVGGEWDVAANGGLTLLAQYVRSRSRNAESVLPPASAEVQAAFPDRYRRDATGRLILVDARPVAFAAADRDQIHWGFSFRHLFRASSLSAASSGQESDDGDAPPPRASLRGIADGWRLKGTLSHDWMLKATRQARLGLPVVDLLEGGAFGYGSGIARHRLNAELGLAGHGVGAQVKASWVGPSTIRSGGPPSPSDLRFAPHSQFDLRVYANLGQVLPRGTALNGFRLSIEADNLFDSKQRVTDRSGATPLAYRPRYLDPLGRTVLVALRKTF